jgi:transposase
MPRKRLVLNLSSFEKKELHSCIQMSQDDLRMVRRCEIILMTEKGISLQEIAGQLGLSKTTVNTWRQIFKTKRMSGLKARKPVGRPPAAKNKSVTMQFPAVEERAVLHAADSCIP